MQIWLDTINLELVADAAKTGIISGITTNPTILSKAKSVRNTLLSLLHLQSGPVAVQVTSEDVVGMIDEAYALFDFSNRILVKIPVSRSGLLAMKQLSKKNIPVCATAVFHPTQVLLAIDAQVAYIAPYFSYMDERADAHATLQEMKALSQHSQTKILGASLKSLDDLTYCALLDLAAVTIKDALYAELLSDHPLLIRASQKFNSDWKEGQGNISIKTLLKELPP